MGQSKFAWGCALVAGLIVANQLTAEEENPFSTDEQSALDRVQEIKEAVAEQVEAEPAQEPPRSRHDAQRRIEAILDQPLRNPIETLATPLNQITDILEEEYGLPIEFDVNALDAVTLSPDTEVNADYSNLSLRSALELMLNQVEDLTYVIDNEVLLITTQEEEGRRLETRVYRVDDLGIKEPPMPSGASAWAWHSPVVNVVTSCVERDSWKENGTGEGAILALGEDLIVVTTTRRVHQQIDQLFDEIRRASKEVEDSAAAKPAADRPITKGIRITQDFAEDTDSQRQLIRDLVMKSVDWAPSGEIADDDVFFEIIPGRIFVRHLPHVVHQVEDVVREMQLSGYTGGGTSGGFGGMSAAKSRDLAEPRKPSEDGGKPKRGGGF